MSYVRVTGPLRYRVLAAKRAGLIVPPAACPDCHGAALELWIVGVNPEQITDVRWQCAPCNGLERRRAKYPLRIRKWANRVVTQAIELGIIQRVTTCEQCGSTHHVHAHHDDHRKPLDIRWLCAACHGITRRRIANGGPL